MLHIETIDTRLVDEYNEAVDRYKEYMIAPGMQIAGIERNFRKVKYFE